MTLPLKRDCGLFWHHLYNMFLIIFGHFWTFWDNLDPFWLFHTKLDFLPRKHKVLLGKNDLEPAPLYYVINGRPLTGMDLTVPFVKYFVVGINQLIRKIKIIFKSLCSGKHLEREQVEREVPRRDQAGHSHLKNIDKWQHILSGYKVSLIVEVSF